MPTDRDSREVPRWVLPLVVGAAFAVALWLLRPLVISGDGVGYIKRLVSPQSDVVPGHLVYIPLLEWARRTFAPDGGHGAAALLSTTFSSLSGGAACGLLFAMARRFTGRVWLGLVAALGLAASYGFYRASGDVEAYATCVALMTLAATILLHRPVVRLGWGSAVAAGLVLGLLTLFHTSLVLFAPFVFVAVWKVTGSWRKGIASLLVGGALSLATFLAVAMGALHMDGSATLSWMMTSDNGYAQRPEATLGFVLRNAGRVFYGMGRTLVHSPAPDRLGTVAAFWLSLSGISYFVISAVGLGVVLRLRVERPVRGSLSPLWAWVLPLVLFGFLFWPSATERWVLILPALWLCGAVALGALRRPALAGVAAAVLVGVPVLFNLFTVIEERRLDRRTLDRSDAVTDLLTEGDLLLFPGHTWDEYVGFYEDAPVERFILASFAGEERGDREALLERLETRIDGVHERGGRVIAVRVFDAPDSHHGWSLMRAMGIPRDDVLMVLARYESRRILQDPVGVWEVLPAESALADEPLAATR